MLVVRIDIATVDELLHFIACKHQQTAAVTERLIKVPGIAQFQGGHVQAIRTYLLINQAVKHIFRLISKFNHFKFCRLHRFFF